MAHDIDPDENGATTKAFFEANYDQPLHLEIAKTISLEANVVAQAILTAQPLPEHELLPEVQTAVPRIVVNTLAAYSGPALSRRVLRAFAWAAEPDTLPEAALLIVGLIKDMFLRSHPDSGLLCADLALSSEYERFADRFKTDLFRTLREERRAGHA